MPLAASSCNAAHRRSSTMVHSQELRASVTLCLATSSCNPACQERRNITHSRLQTRIAGASHQIDPWGLDCTNPALVCAPHFCAFFLVKSSSRMLPLQSCTNFANFAGLIFQKCSERLSFSTFWSAKRPYYHDPRSHITRTKHRVLHLSVFIREFSRFRTAALPNYLMMGDGHDGVVDMMVEMLTMTIVRSSEVFWLNFLWLFQLTLALMLDVSGENRNWLVWGSAGSVAIWIEGLVEWLEWGPRGSGFYHPFVSLVFGQFSSRHSVRPRMILTLTWKPRSLDCRRNHWIGCIGSIVHLGTAGVKSTASPSIQNFYFFGAQSGTRKGNQFWIHLRHLHAQRFKIVSPKFIGWLDLKIAKSLFLFFSFSPSRFTCASWFWLSPTCFPLWVLWAMWFLTCPPWVLLAPWPRDFSVSPTCLPLVSQLPHTCFPPWVLWAMCL